MISNYKQDSDKIMPSLSEAATQNKIKDIRFTALY